jgi:hypothetical protein
MSTSSYVEPTHRHRYTVYAQTRIGKPLYHTAGDSFALALSLAKEHLRAARRTVIVRDDGQTISLERT